MNKQLINAVKRQIGSDSKQVLQDVYNHGASAGWSGFTYYTDTVAFYKRQRKNIVELVEELADALGTDPISLVCGFNCLKGYCDDQEGRQEVIRALYGRIKSDDTQVCNALAWFALEEVARYVVELTDAA